MKAIEFYKFISENEIEFHWYENPKTKQQDVMIYPCYHHLEDLAKLLNYTCLDITMITFVMKVNYCATWASQLLDPHGITLNEIFGEDTQG